MSTPNTDSLSSTLVHLTTIAEATENLRAIFQILKNLGYSEMVDWTELKPALLFLGRLGMVNCLDTAEAVVATRVRVMSALEQH